MDFTVTVNMKGLNKYLSKLPGRVNGAIKNALRESSLKVQNQAKINAPVKTGNLRRGITHKVNRNLTANIGTDVEYARIREYHTKRLPHGYLRPALKINRKVIETIFNRHIKKALKS